MLRNYIKIAWKVLRRNPFFTFVSLFGISLTIGIVLILATLFEQLVGKHYPENPAGHTLMVANVNLNDGKGSNYAGSLGFHLIHDYILNLKSPKRVAYSGGGYISNSFVKGKKLELKISATNEEFWNMHAFTFLAGKPFTQNEIKDKVPVAIITRGTSEAYFGEIASVLGKTIKLDNNQYQVIGVIENISATSIHLYADVYIPHFIERDALQSQNLTGGFYAFLEGESENDLDEIRSEYQSVVERIETQLKKDPVDGRYSNMSSYAVSNLERVSYIFSSNNMSPAVGKLLMVLGIPMLLFMLLPAMNLVNLNSSRIMDRASEIGVRKAFGATSGNLVFQFIVENIIVTLIGGALGLLLALLGLELIESSGFIKYAELGLRFNVFLFALLLCLFFGILSGVLPAWRMSKIQVVNALKGMES